MNPIPRTLEAGKRFGRLTTLEPAAHSRALVRCRCDCGTVTKAQAYALLANNTRSCGCLRAEHAAAQAHHASRHASLQRKLPPPDELRWLLDAGETIPILADRFRVKESTIERALLRDRTREAAS